ncbi:WD_REPEATS_REGION domain-containing protein, partial [Linnemannia gamsii]
MSSSSTQGSRLPPQQSSALDQVTSGMKSIPPQYIVRVRQTTGTTGNFSTTPQCEDIANAESTGSCFNSLAPRSMPPLTLDLAPPPDVQEISSFDVALQDMRKQRMDHYRQDVYIAPMAKPNLLAPDDNLFPLMEKVKEFLAGDAHVMLILGDSGAGKSTFNRYLENVLWKDYKIGDRIPLFINLPNLERPDKDLVAEQLRTFDFSNDAILKMKWQRRFTLVCDGYDESQLTCNLHTTNLLNQPGQWDTKLIITCRSQYLGCDYRNRFVPDVAGRYFQSANDLFQEAVIAPFSKDQTEDYVEQYVPLEPRPWVKEDYMDKLMTIPNLMDMVKNPFLLSLCLEALPSVIKGETDLSRLHVTRVQLYDNFVWHWMAVNKRRLQHQKLSNEHLEAYEALLDDGFEKAGIKFQQDLAAAIFQEQDGRPIVDYAPRRDKGTWKAAFFSSEAETSHLRCASLLSRAGGQYRFFHRSILEYFYSCTIYLPISIAGEFVPKDPCDFSVGFLSITGHSLSKRSLVEERSIVQFLAERVRSNSDFEQQLLDILERSKIDDQAIQAAANAITILVRAGVRFNSKDLRGIRIPTADLTAGQFDHAKFQGADLTKVNFTKSWIRQADFTGAQMEGVQFGELVDLKMFDWVMACAFSPDGKTFVGGLISGDILVYDTATWTKVSTVHNHQEPVSNLIFSPSGQHLLSVTKNNTVRFCEQELGWTDLVLEGHSDIVTALAISPSGMQIASGSHDNTVRLWDAQSNPATFISLDHNSRVSSVAYSPDGRYIASGGHNGTIRIFDTQTGEPRLILESESQNIVCIAYSPDGQCIVSADDEGQLQLWKTTNDRPGSKWTGHSGGISSVTFSPSGPWFASSSYDNTVKLWHAQSRALISVFSGHSDVVTMATFSPDGSQLLSSSWDGTVRIWQMNLAEAVFDSSGTTNPVTSMVYTPNGRHLFVGTRDGHMYQYDACTGVSGLIQTGVQAGVNCVAYSPDGLRFVTVGYSCDVQIWNAETSQVDFVLVGHTEAVTAAAFSPCGSWIATGGKDTTVRLWNAHSGRPGPILTSHTEAIVSVSFSQSGDQIVTG